MAWKLFLSSDYETRILSNGRRNEFCLHYIISSKTAYHFLKDSAQSNFTLLIHMIDIDYQMIFDRCVTRRIRTEISKGFSFLSSHAKPEVAADDFRVDVIELPPL